MNTPFRTLLLLLSLATGLAAAEPARDEVRLSKALATAEFSAAGLTQLNSDQLAVLDALVRRDMVTAQSTVSGRAARAARFSERLTADELKNSGLTSLSEAQLEQLDQYVARLSAPVVSGSAVLRSSGDASGVVTSTSLRRAPEIHGMISLMYGVGSGGYSERGGAMVLTYDDPSGISLAVGYSEVRTKGGYGYFRRDCRDPYFGGLDRPMW
ncbi:MAG: hypothetical protein ABIZ04_26565 [Opitutus sp.]